ncbi:pentapeptide repeat-containing protein [Lentisphaerota bacterium WC36G]|nr:pentapeptide repeat-containing protein [Lentisphaerae bacterium WC36]
MFSLATRKKLDKIDAFLNKLLKKIKELTYLGIFTIILISYTYFFISELNPNGYQKYFVVIFTTFIIIYKFALFFDFKKSFFTSSKERLTTLIYIVSFELLCIITQWQNIHQLLGNYEWLKPIAFSIVAAIPATYLWYWRDKHKVKDHQQKEDEINLQKSTNDWENYFKWIEIACDETKSDNLRASAIKALSTYYDKGQDYANQVNEFYKNYLNEFWGKFNFSSTYINEARRYSNTTIFQFSENIDFLSFYNDTPKNNENDDCSDIAIKEFKEKAKFNEKLTQYLTVIYTLEDDKDVLLRFVEEAYKHIPLYIKETHNIVLSHLKTDKYLSNFNLSFANIHMKYFYQCKIFNVNFNYSKMNRTNFRNCEFDNTNINHANLFRVNFLENSFFQSGFYNCNVQNGCFDDSKFDESIIGFRHISFKNCSFNFLKQGKNSGNYKKNHDLFFDNCTLKNEK